jgi:hypothetical protein
MLLTGSEDDEVERTAAAQHILLLYKPLDVQTLIEQIESLRAPTRNAATAN